MHGPQEFRAHMTHTARLQVPGCIPKHPLQSESMSLGLECWRTDSVVVGRDRETCHSSAGSECCHLVAGSGASWSGRAHGAGP